MKSFTPYLLLCCLLTVSSSIGAQIVGDTMPCAQSTSYYSVPGANVTFWYVSGSNPYSHLTSDQLQVGWNTSGTYTIGVIYTTTPGVSDTAILTVHVQPLPQPEIATPNFQGCVTQQIRGTLTNTSRELATTRDNLLCYTSCDSGWYKYTVTGSVGSTFAWSTPHSATVIPNTGGDTVMVKWMGTGYTTLTVTETNSDGCADSSEVCVNVIEEPDACFTSVPGDSAGIIHLCLNSTLVMNDACSMAPFGSSLISNTWILGDGTELYNESVAEHAYATADTYQVKLVVVTNCNCADTFIRTVVVSESTGPDIYCINTVCHDSVSTFTTSDTCASLVWGVYGGDTLSPTHNDSITVRWGNGNTGFGVIELLSSCSGGCPYPTQAYVPIVPQNALITGDTIVCNSSTELYSVPFVPTTVYTWKKDGALLSSTTNAASIYWHTNFSVPEAGHSIEITYQNPFLQCSGSSTAQIIIAGPLSILGDTLLCANEDAQFFASTGMVSVNSHWVLYSLSTNDTVDTATGISAIFSGLAPGLYDLYAYPDTGYFCGTPVIRRLRVIASPGMPSQNIIGPDTVCANALVSYSTTAAASGYYMEWSAVTGTPATGSGEHFSTMWSLPLPAVIKLRQVMISEPGCTGAWKTDTIYRNTVNVPAISGNDTVCSDDTVSYTIAADAEYYSWSITDPLTGSISLGQYTNTVRVQWNHTGSPTDAYLTVDVHQCDTIVSRTMHIAITGVPDIVIDADTTPFCANETIYFSSSVTGSAYLWDFGDGSTSTGATPTHAYSADGSYPVVVTVTAPNGCNTTASGATTISMLPQPVALLTTPQPTSYCTPHGWEDSLFVTLQNMNGGSFTFELFKDNVSQGAAGSISIFVVDSAGQYKVKVTSLATGCWGFTNIITITDTCTTGCYSASTITFTHSYNCGKLWVDAQYTHPPVTFTSFHFGEPGSLTNAAFTDTASHVYNDAGYYNVYVYGTALDTSGTDTCILRHLINVAIPLVPHLSVQHECRNDSLFTNLIDVSTYVGTPISGWQWRVDGTPVSTLQNPELYLTSGQHIITLQVRNSADTCDVTDTIIVPDRVQANFTSLDSVCETNAVQFISTSTGDVVSYLWDYTDGSFSALQNSEKVYICNLLPGETYCIDSIILTVMDAYGCVSRDTQSRIVYDYLFSQPALVFLPQTVTKCYEDDTTIIVTITDEPGTGPYSYIWSDGHSGTTGTEEILYNITNTGSYSITVTDTHGCEAIGGTTKAYFESVSTILKGDTFVCYGQKINLNIFNGHGYTYSWKYQRPADTGWHDVTYSPPYLFNTAMLQAYDSTLVWGVITSPGGCTDIVGPVRLHMLPVPGTDFDWSYWPLPPCANQGPVTAVVSSPDADYFIWGNGTISDTLVANAAGVYQVVMVDTNGCKSADRELFLPGGPDFSQLITGCYTRCISDTTRLYAPSAPVNHTYRYEWILNDSAVISTAQTPIVTVSGTYTLAIYDSIWGYGFICPDTSKPIYLEIVSCTNNWCADDIDSLPCATCYYDSVTGQRIISLVVNFNYISTGPVVYGIYSSTDNVLNYYNTAPAFIAGGMLHSAGSGRNKIYVDIADTTPFNTMHNIVIDIGSCQFEINIETPVSCAGGID